MEINRARKIELWHKEEMEGFKGQEYNFLVLFFSIVTER